MTSYFMPTFYYLGLEIRPHCTALNQCDSAASRLSQLQARAQDYPARLPSLAAHRIASLTFRAGNYIGVWCSKKNSGVQKATQMFML
jgi:hypothetical protein